MRSNSGRLLLAAMVALSWQPAIADVTDKPNVVMIYVDDLGYGDVSCYGATKIQTPHVDRLAKDGLRFTNGRCATATCTPSRYSLLTGEYAWRKQGTDILPGNAALIIPQNRTTLGKVFQNAGYKTGCVGKWHLGLGPKGGPDWNGEIKPGPNEVGFDFSFIFPATADRVPTVYVKNHSVVALEPTDPIEVNYKKKIGNEPTGKENPELLTKMTASTGHFDTIVNGIARIGWMTGGHKARWTDESLAGDFTDEAELFIERNQKNPFFLYFALNDIHEPRLPGTRFKGRSIMGYRGDVILQMDYTVGRIMKKLDETGLTSNTMVLFTSDNGPVLMDGYDDMAVEKLNGHTPAGPMRGGKYSIFEGGTRVPFIVHWPAKVKPGVSDALVSQVDLVASFAALTGQKLSPADAPDSVDLVKALLGKSETGRESLVVQANTLALISGDWKYIAPKKGRAFFENKQMESGLSKNPQLYNLRDDIGEKHNLATEKPGIVKQMAAELKKIRAESNQ